MKGFFAVTLAVACLIAGAIAQEPQAQFLTPVGQQAFASIDQAQLHSVDEEESGIRNKRQYGFGGGYGGYGGGYGGGRGGYGGYGGGGRGYGGGGYGGRGFGGGYGGYGR